LVLELTSDTFDNYVGSDKYALVEFYTKWCRYCKDLAPEYEKLYEHYKQHRQDVIISRIEGGANYAVLARYGIQSFPIIALFIPGDKRIKNVYQGPRTFERFNEWITALCPVIPVKNNTKLDNNGTNSNNSSESEVEAMKQQIEKMKNEFNEINKVLSETKEKMNNLRNNGGSSSSSSSKGKKIVIEIDMSISSVIKLMIVMLVVIAVVITARKLIHYNAVKKDI
jgi:protein disulfide-isomerase-like protein